MHRGSRTPTLRLASPPRGTQTRDPATRRCSAASCASPEERARRGWRKGLQMGGGGGGEGGGAQRAGALWRGRGEACGRCCRAGGGEMARPVIFSTSTCSWCRRAKRYLKDQRVPFEEV